MGINGYGVSVIMEKFIPLGHCAKSLFTLLYCSYCSKEINVSAGVTQVNLHQETKKILRTKSLQESK